MEVDTKYLHLNSPELLRYQYHFDLDHRWGLLRRPVRHCLRPSEIWLEMLLKQPSVPNLDEASQQYDDRCEELWGALRDEAGAWVSHRFKLKEWNTPEIDRVKATARREVQHDDSGSFDGCLTKELIASGLSMLDRCPEFYHYAYIKCELHKKRLTDIEALASYHYLQYVDVSGNKLTTLKALGNLPFLKYLDASHNQLTTILDFKAPYFLTTVNMANNNFKVMRDLGDFWSITDLNLSHNNIKVIDGLLELRYLTTLNLSFNWIEAIDNLKDLRIQFLDLKHNLIKSSEDDEKAMLYTLNNIRTINLGHNQVSSLKMFESVENLESLEIPNNNISQLLDIYYLRNLKYLNRLNLAKNAVTCLRRYVEVCVTNIRNLVYLDGEHINYEFWLHKLSNKAIDVSQTAAHQRLKLLILEQLNTPVMWEWLLPFDTPPLAIIVLVGLHGSRRGHIAKKFCDENKNVVVGIPYTTREKHPDEIDGEQYYYVNDEKFRTMLKEGKFLTYQEHLGSYYGFAHSEFKKAENGILLFYTDLTMALCIKSRFLNTKLILTLPSTRKVHFENLTKLYAIRLVDMGTVKIINSAMAVKYCEMEFNKQKTICLEKEVKFIIEDLVTQVSDSRAHENLVSETIAKPASSPRLPVHGSIMHHNDRNLTIDSVPKKREDFSDSLEGFRRNQSQTQRYVSFTGTQEPEFKRYEWEDSETKQYKTKEDARSTFEQDAWDATENRDDCETGPTSEQLFEVMPDDSREGDDDVEELAKVPPPKPSSYFVNRHSSYSSVITEDARIKAIFDGELDQRDELLDLHWSMPGLFRELLFTDHEDETLEKLRQLVIDLTRCCGTQGMPMFNYENDESCKSLTAAKIKKCFINLERELSISAKQASEFVIEDGPHVCGNTSCTNPVCPPF